MIKTCTLKESPPAFAHTFLLSVVFSAASVPKHPPLICFQPHLSVFLFQYEPSSREETEVCWMEGSRCAQMWVQPSSYAHFNSLTGREKALWKEENDHKKCCRTKWTHVCPPIDSHLSEVGSQRQQLQEGNPDRMGYTVPPACSGSDPGPSPSRTGPKSLQREATRRNSNQVHILPAGGPNSCKRSHVTPVLMSLHWLPIGFRIQFKVPVLVHRAQMVRLLLILMNFYQQDHSSRTLRSSDQGLLVGPRTRLRTLRFYLLNSGTENCGLCAHFSAEAFG